MNYTVNQVATLSGVTIRTLRFYDEIGLLKPAHVGENKYRYYGKDQLLLLQQILLFKELGFELEQIKEIMKQSDFNKLQALQTHVHTVQKRMEKLAMIAKTIDKTINYLEGIQTMADKEMYYGLNDEKQQEYEQYLIKRHGKVAKKHIDESRQTVKSWKQADWQKAGKTFDDLCLNLALLLQKKHAADSAQVQAVVARHYDWLKQFWTPNRESYIGLGLGYTEPEWQARFAPYHPDLAEFLATAMKVFADQELA